MISVQKEFLDEGFGQQFAWIDLVNSQRLPVALASSLPLFATNAPNKKARAEIPERKPRGSSESGSGGVVFLARVTNC